MKKPKRIAAAAQVHPDDRTALRVVEVETQHGTFYRLMHVTMRGDQIVAADWAHEHFQGVDEILARAEQIHAAMCLPMLNLCAVSAKH